MSRAVDPASPGRLDVLVGGRGPVVIAHRGASSRAPENTVPAIDLAIAAGADAVELDVWVTGDDVPVIAHDPTTERMGGRRVVLERSSLRELREIDAGHGFTADGGASFPWRGKGVLVPTLAEVLERYAGVAILLELKSPGGQAAVRHTLDRHGAATHVVVASALHAALGVFRDGRYARSASRREIARWFFGAQVGLAPHQSRYQMLSIPPRKGVFTLTGPRAVAAATRAGIPVHVWTIDDGTEAQRLWQAGVTGIITNDPGALIAARSRLETP